MHLLLLAPHNLFLFPLPDCVFFIFVVFFIRIVVGRRLRVCTFLHCKIFCLCQYTPIVEAFGRRRCGCRLVLGHSRECSSSRRGFNLGGCEHVVFVIVSVDRSRRGQRGFWCRIGCVIRRSG